MVESDEYDDDEEFIAAQVETDENPAERGKWLSALIALAGVWLMVTPWVWFSLAPSDLWNVVIVGGLLTLVGGYNYYRRASEELASTATAVLAALLGLWLVVFPFLFDLEAGLDVLLDELWVWNNVIVGAIVAALGAYSAYESNDTYEEEEEVVVTE